jgi:hypothetical protein
MKCHPSRWVGLGFVSTIENAPGQILSQIEGITAVAVQIAWGVDPVKPEVMEDYLDDLVEWGLKPVGWAWCDAESEQAARDEALVHARIAGNLGLNDFIANQEEEYDAHGDAASPKYHMSDAYCASFRSILPDIEFAVTTLNRPGSNQVGMREAGAVLMPQCFSEEAPGATIDVAMNHAAAWGWTMDRVRPLVQVYETKGVVPDPNVYLQESADWEVGVIPYILEQALSGQGAAALAALVPAITRQPMPSPPTNGDIMPPIGSQHGIEATYNRLKKIDPAGCNPAFDPKHPDALPVDQLKAYDKWCRTMLILVQDHDAGM